MPACDYITLKCPQCQTDIEFMTYAGRCEGETYTKHDAPAALAANIRDRTELCPKCSSPVIAKARLIVLLEPEINSEYEKPQTDRD